MDNLGILIQAILSLKDTTDSKNQIAKELPKLESQLQSDKNTRVKIVAGLDIGKSKSLIQSQLNTLANQAKAPTIKVGIDTSGVGNTQNIANGLKEVEKQAQKTANAVNDVKSELLKLDTTAVENTSFEAAFVNEEKTILDLEKTLANARQELSKFGKVEFSWMKDSGGNVSDIIAKITDATGVIENFHYALNEGSANFGWVGSVGTDSGIAKLSAKIEETRVKYSRLLADFKSSNSAIQSGLTDPIRKFETVLNGLGKTSSINDVKNAFESLKQSASEITTYLDTTNSSFNKSTNAINNYKNMDNILKEMATSFDNLVIKPENLRTELDGVKTKLAELQDLEKTEGGYTKVWAEKYREVNLELAQVKTNIELALKAEGSSQKADKNSAYQTQLKYLNKIKEETNTIISLKKKIVNAGDKEKSVYQREITNAQKRIQYDTQQLEKKHLLTDEAKRLVNTYKEQIALQDKINTAKTSDKNIQSQSKQLKDFVGQIKDTIAKINALQNSTTFTKNTSNSRVMQIKDELAQLLVEYEKVIARLQGDSITSNDFKGLSDDLAKLNANFDLVYGSAKQFETELKNDNGAEKFAQRVSLLSTQIKEFKNTNTKSLKKFGSTFDEMLSELNNPNIDPQAYERIRLQFQAIKREINATGLAGKTFFERMKEQAAKFSSWMSLTGVITSLWHDLKQMVTNVIELDKAMTNLKKVTDETEVVYSRFLKNASQQAKEFHSTVTDLIEQTSQWAKLGYNLEQANKLAKASMIYANVGEVDNEQAVTNIVSAVKAFDIAVDDIMSIPDVYNKLGNEFAVSSKNLGIGMSQAATTMALAGNDFNQVAALLTGAGEILGDNKLDEIGNGLKTVTLRIQNQAGALKELGEEYEDLVSVSKTQQQVYELTGGKVNIMSATDPNEFRDTYNILKDVANVINDLNGTDASELVQLLFGKNRANVGTAILKAFQSGQIEKAYEAAKNSAGSAQKEFDSWSQSIEAHINTFKASFESLSQTVIDSDLIKFVVDFGTTILNTLDSVISKFGTIPTLLGSIATVGAIKNVGELLNTPVYAQPQLICA